MVHLETFKQSARFVKSVCRARRHIKSDQASTGEMFVLIIFSERSDDIFKYNINNTRELPKTNVGKKNVLNEFT